MRYLGCAEPDEEGGGCWALLRRYVGNAQSRPSSCRNGPRPRKLTCIFHARHEDDAQRARAQRDGEQSDRSGGHGTAPRSAR